MAALAQATQHGPRRLPRVLRRLPQPGRAAEGGRHHRPPERRALRARPRRGLERERVPRLRHAVPAHQGSPRPPGGDGHRPAPALRRRARHVPGQAPAARGRAVRAAPGAEAAAAVDRRAGREAPAPHGRPPCRRLERAVPLARVLRHAQRHPERLVREGAARSAVDRPHLQRRARHRRERGAGRASRRRSSSSCSAASPTS